VPAKFMALRDDFGLANERARELQRSVPRAVAAHYDRKTGRIVVELSSKVTVSFSPRDAEGLEDATPSQLDAIEISPSGFGIHFPALDADLYVPTILAGLLGSKRWVASRLGEVRPVQEQAYPSKASSSNNKGLPRASKPT
jgi:hypothetical protein